jgi:L-threonylcarbamoyladenylate synthase
MIQLRVDPHHVTADVLMPAIRALRDGGVVAFPTETFYGLAVDPRLSFAVTKLFELKRRPAAQPIP